MKVILTPHGDELEVDNIRRVHALLDRLDIIPGTVLVIRGENLLTADAELGPHDEIELRSVVSGG